MPRMKRKPWTHKKKRTTTAAKPQPVEVVKSPTPSPEPESSPYPEPQSSPLVAKKARAVAVASRKANAVNTTLRGGKKGKKENVDEMDICDSEEDNDVFAEELRNAVIETKKGRRKVQVAANKKEDALRFISPTATNNRVNKRAPKEKEVLAVAKKPPARQTKASKNALGGYLEKGFIINETGAIVEAELYEDDDVTLFKPVQHVTRVTDLKELSKIRVQDLKSFINDGLIHANQMKNIKAIISCYEKDCEIVPWAKPKRNMTADEKEFVATVSKLDRPWLDGMTYWCNGEQISEFQRMTIKGDNNVWTEPSLLEMGLCRGPGARSVIADTTKNKKKMKGAVGTALRMNNANQGQGHAAAAAAAGLPDPNQNHNPPTSHLLGGIVGTGPLQTLNLERAVMRYNCDVYGTAHISVAVKYPAHESTPVHYHHWDNRWGNRYRVIVSDMVFDTGCSTPVLNQHVIDELNLRWTLNTAPQAHRMGLANGVRIMAQRVPIMYQFMMNGQPATPWFQSWTSIPEAHDFNRYDIENLSGFPITGAMHWLIARDPTNRTGVIYAARNWRAMDHYIRNGTIRLQ